MVHELTGYKNKKAYIIFGSAMCFKAILQKQHSVQISFYEQALDSFKKYYITNYSFQKEYYKLISNLRAHSLDPGDFLPLYHIARCYSILRQVKI
jgi:hypothetical protein